jgi:hypothetical protein
MDAQPLGIIHGPVIGVIGGDVVSAYEGRAWKIAA